MPTVTVINEGASSDAVREILAREFSGYNVAEKCSYPEADTSDALCIVVLGGKRCANIAYWDHVLDDNYTGPVKRCIMAFV